MVNRRVGIVLPVAPPRWLALKSYALSCCTRNQSVPERPKPDASVPLKEGPNKHIPINAGIRVEEGENFKQSGGKASSSMNLLSLRLTVIAAVMSLGVLLSWWTCSPVLGLCRAT